MKYISFLSVLLCITFPRSYAQNNSNAGLQAKAQQYANEVFLNCNQYAQPAYIPDYVNILSRTEVTTTATYTSGYVLLSTVLLKDKCNPDLVRDNATNFDPDNFNPLKYNLDYYPKNTDKAYKVDGTSYIIIIHHVN